MTPRKRTYHKWPCSRCDRIVSTSSFNKDYICTSCRRAAGLTVMGKKSDGYTSLTIAPHQVQGFGTCKKCKRSNQKLSNECCEDCHFYGIPETDWILSEQGRKSQGGEFDYIKRRNK